MSVSHSRHTGTPSWRSYKESSSGSRPAGIGGGVVLSPGSRSGESARISYWARPPLNCPSTAVTRTSGPRVRGRPPILAGSMAMN
jgi:hypothetical protein